MRIQAANQTFSPVDIIERCNRNPILPTVSGYSSRSGSLPVAGFLGQNQQPTRLSDRYVTVKVLVERKVKSGPRQLALKLQASR